MDSLVNLAKIKACFANGRLFVEVISIYPYGRSGLISCSNLNRVIMGDIKDTLFPYYALGIIFLGENYKFETIDYPTLEELVKEWKIVDES